jgi:hypothetical protein
MGLMDKVRAQSTQLAQMAQETAREGKVKLDQAQAKRRADAMFRDLGATVYAERTGRGTPDSKGKIDRLVDALSRQEASQGLQTARLPGARLPGARLPAARLPAARLPAVRLPAVRLPAARLREARGPRMPLLRARRPPASGAGVSDRRPGPRWRRGRRSRWRRDWARPSRSSPSSRSHPAGPAPWPAP